MRKTHYLHTQQKQTTREKSLSHTTVLWFDADNNLRQLWSAELNNLIFIMLLFIYSFFHSNFFSFYTLRFITITFENV